MRVIDSHTGGEPTRVVIDGGPDLGTGSLADRKTLLAEKFDTFRTTVILEPRGSDALVGALLCEPSDASCVAGVIFFNNAGYLGICTRGLIGLAVALAYLATGHNMLGMSLATATGRLVTEIVQRQTPHIDADVFSPARF